MTEIIVVADLPDPSDPQGRSYREVNAEKAHGIALGALVELENGVRMLVVYQGRDCDQTPLYWLAHEMTKFGDDEPDGKRWERAKWVGGFAEEDLRVIDCVPLQDSQT